MKTKNLQGLMMGMSLLLFGSIHAQQLAFPGAKGFGAYASGGRGGTVYHVTNLNATGTGSLLDAVSQPNRTVVFDVGGVIKITTSTIIMVASNVTIAGQTAPGDGITLYGNRFVTNGSNVIVRYMRFRGSINMSEDKCTVTADNASNIIYDHCSISWGRWDNIHITNSNNITFQYCLIAEGIDPQRFGAITDGTRNWTVQHCLWADLKSRNPKMKCFLQYINNVVYNWGCCGIVGGHSAADNYQDVINNYFIAGPTSDITGYLSDWTSTDHLYSSGNYIDLDKNGTLNGTLMTSYAGATVQTSPYLTSPVPVTVESAASAYNTVVSSVGASKYRDAHDTRIINQLKSLGKQGTTIADESVVGGIGTLRNGTPALDTDKDGMPDAWETANGCDPKVADNNKAGSGGYTKLENYINSLVPTPKSDDAEEDVTSIAEHAESTLTCYPNPFSDETTIQFNLAKEEKVTLNIYDLNGKNVCTLVNQVMPAGNHQIVWQGDGIKGQRLTAGVYLCTLQTANNKIVKKVSLSK